jgi:hypothetical protein
MVDTDVTMAASVHRRQSNCFYQGVAVLTTAFGMARSSRASRATP